MMILPLLLIMILPKMMNDPETRKVWQIRCFCQTLQICMDSGAKSMLHSVVLSVQGDCHRLLCHNKDDKGKLYFPFT